MASEGLSHAVDRLVEIKAELSRLGEEKAALEAKLLKAAQEDLRDTKRKSVSYGGGLGRATAIMADSVKLVYPSLLRKIFGPVYEDAVNVKCDAKLTAPAARLLAGLWNGNYSRTGIARVIEQLPCGDRAKELLKKKLKGINYETDRKTLIAIGGFEEAEAGDYAFFVAEAAVWDSFLQLLRARTPEGREPDETEIQEALQLIDAAIVVEQTPKVSLEALTPCEAS